MTKGALAKFIVVLVALLVKLQALLKVLGLKLPPKAPKTTLVGRRRRSEDPALYCPDEESLICELSRALEQLSAELED